MLQWISLALKVQAMFYSINSDFFTKYRSELGVYSTSVLCPFFKMSVSCFLFPRVRPRSILCFKVSVSVLHSVFKVSVSCTSGLLISNFRRLCRHLPLSPHALKRLHNSLSSPRVVVVESDYQCPVSQTQISDT